MTDRKDNINRRQIKLRVELFDEDLIFDHYDVQCWGRRKELIASEMIIVDAALARQFPSILPDNVEKRKRLLATLGPHPREKVRGGKG